MASSTSGTSGLIPPMDNDWEYLHGRVDPGQDENLNLLESVEVEVPGDADLEKRNTLSSPKETDESSNSPQNVPDFVASYPSPKGSRLTRLPSELIDLVLSFVGPVDLVAVSSTCKLLSGHGKSDLSWQRHVQENVPGVTLTSPYPCSTFRELYIAHDPHWFLPKYKVWFCDYFLTGKVIITRYDPRRGCIEGYRLVAERPPPTFDPWEADDQVLIHSFNPRCRLHMDQPVLQLDALRLESLMASSTRTKPAHRFCAETPMHLEEGSHHGVFSNFLLTNPSTFAPTCNSGHLQRFQLGTVFGTPVNKPSEAGVTNHIRGEKLVIKLSGLDDGWRWLLAQPQRGYTSEKKFILTQHSIQSFNTPTEEKPFRGIWVGDYSGHGCEFLLMNQPDNEDPFDEASIIQAEYETTEEWEARKKDERIYRGRLEAIKLTGDLTSLEESILHFRRYLEERTFRIATEKQFHGARIVRSRGHVAARMFQDDKYIESQLIMVSHDRLAQYWVGFGHISFYERVNIDKFLSPAMILL